MIHPKTLQQRLMLFLMLPVTMLLIAMGTAGFIYARDSILEQWREAGFLKLQRAAHNVDMRLQQPKEWMKMFLQTGGKADVRAVREMLLERIESTEGVAWVRLDWRRDEDAATPPMLRMTPRHHDAGGGETARMMSMPRHFHQGRIAEVTSPRYDVSVDGRTVSIISNLNDAEGRTIGTLTAAVRFDYLVDAVSTSDLWERYRAYLVDGDGHVLAGNTETRPRRLGESGDELGKAALAEMAEHAAGAVMGEGKPPEEIIGFFRLHEAPWFLVISAPGREVLAPIVRFRDYYLVGAAFFILVTLLLIRWVAGRTVVAVKSVSEAAREIAEGRLDHHLSVKSRDEVGELVASFNTMTRQLEERLRLKNSLNLAMEVQQNLLPSEPLIIEGIDIAGTSRYCDETGGDYYDFISLPEMGPGRIGVRSEERGGGGCVGPRRGRGPADDLRPGVHPEPDHSRPVPVPNDRGRQPAALHGHHPERQLHDPVFPPDGCRRPGNPMDPGGPRTGHRLRAGDGRLHRTRRTRHGPGRRSREPLRGSGMLDVGAGGDHPAGHRRAVGNGKRRRRALWAGSGQGPPAATPPIFFGRDHRSHPGCP